jgi:FtsZ-binding cell division protein ZapB
VSNWRELFQAAQLKTNSPDFEQCVTAAQQAIDERMRELIQENIQASKEEREIRDAVQTLKVLRREIEENKRRTAG